MSKRGDQLGASTVRIFAASKVESETYYDAVAIRELIERAFTTEDLLRFIQDHPSFRPVLKHVGRSVSLDEATSVLTAYCQNRLLLDELLLGIQRYNPNQYGMQRGLLYNGKIADSARYETGVRQLLSRMREGHLCYPDAVDLLRQLRQGTPPGDLVGPLNKLALSTLYMSFTDWCDLIAYAITQKLAGYWDKTVVGMGVLIEKEKVLTSTEVLARVRALSPDPLDTQPIRAKLDFPLAAPRTTVAAYSHTLLRHRGVTSLTLEEDSNLPENIRPIHLTATDQEDLQGHRCWVYGLLDYADEMWASGEVVNQSDSGWLRIRDKGQSDSIVRPGFSGAPVWDEQLEATIGVMLIGQEDEAKVAYVIPTHAVLRDCPDFQSNRSTSSAQKSYQTGQSMNEPAPRSPATLDRETLFGALWTEFAHLGDAVAMLNSESRVILSSLETELSGVCELVNRHSAPEKWQSLEKAISDFYQYAISTQANRSMKQLGRMVAQLVNRFKDHLPADELVSRFEVLAKQLQDLR